MCRWVLCTAWCMLRLQPVASWSIGATRMCRSCGLRITAQPMHTPIWESPQMHLPRGRGGFERRTRQPHDKAVLSLRAAPLVPGDAPRRVVSDLGEHASEVVLRVETVELGAFDQRGDCGSAAAAGNGTGTGVILSSKQRASAAQRARL